jgi:hypothetical protein
MQKKLLVAMVTLCSWAVPLSAQTPPPVQLQIESDRQANLQVQQAVATTWRLPRLTADATVRVRARVLLSGALVDPQIEIEGGTDEENENLRRSVEEAIGRTVVSIAPREIDFVLEANSSAYLPRCFPLRVYIFDTLRDSLEPPPPTSTQAMRLAVSRWHRILASYTDDKQAPPLTIVDDPEQADVWIEPYEKYDDFSA